MAETGELKVKLLLDTSEFEAVLERAKQALEVAAPELRKLCATCKHWAEHTGQCREDSPWLGDEDEAHWPKTHRGCWCGKWERRVSTEERRAHDR